MPAPISSRMKAQIEMLALKGHNASAIARELGLDRHTVARYLAKQPVAPNVVVQRTVVEAQVAQSWPPSTNRVVVAPAPREAVAPATFTRDEVERLRLLLNWVTRKPCQVCGATVYVPRWVLMAKVLCNACGAVLRYPARKVVKAPKGTARRPQRADGSRAAGTRR